MLETLSYAACQIFTLTESWPASPKARGSWSTPCPGYAKKAAMLTDLIVPNWHFPITLTQVFSVLFLSC